MSCQRCGTDDCHEQELEQARQEINESLDLLEEVVSEARDEGRGFEPRWFVRFQKLIQRNGR